MNQRYTVEDNASSKVPLSEATRNSKKQAPIDMDLSPNITESSK